MCWRRKLRAAAHCARSLLLASVKGDLIQTLSWDSTKGAIIHPLTTANNIKVETQYNASGNVTLTKDAKDIQTKFTYDSINNQPDLYPTKIERAYNYADLKRTTEKTYDFSTGLETMVTDADYDDFGRPTLVVAAAGIANVETRTATVYSDVARRVIVRADMEAAGDGKLVTIQHYDPLERIRLSRHLEKDWNILYATSTARALPRTLHTVIKQGAIHS